MRMAGPREAVWHAIIRRNHGANHMIVGRDHAGPGQDSTGKPFYGPYDAQDLVRQFEDEVGVTMMPFSELLYLPDEDRYEETSNIPRARARPSRHAGARGVSGQGSSPARMVHTAGDSGDPGRSLSTSAPPGTLHLAHRSQRLGKSTTAAVLSVLLLEAGRQVTELDGDVVRTHLSKGLGFTREDRDTNILRIGFVASEIVRHGGTVMCAAVSPYRERATRCGP